MLMVHLVDGSFGSAGLLMLMIIVHFLMRVRLLILVLVLVLVILSCCYSSYFVV